MKQELKNKYYALLKAKDTSTLETIQSIFSKIDTLLLTEPSSICQDQILFFISELEFTEEKLYHEIKKDLENHIL